MRRLEQLGMGISSRSWSTENIQEEGLDKMSFKVPPNPKPVWDSL